MFSKCKQNIFLQYVLSYIVILLIPVLAILGISVNTFRQNQQEAVDQYARSFAQSVGNIETRLDELSSLVQLISTDENLVRLLRNPNEGYYTSYKLFQALSNHCGSNALVKSLYVLMDGGGRVIGSDGVIADHSYFYRIKYDRGQEEYVAWLREQENLRSATGKIVLDEVRSGEERETVVLYSQPLLLGAGSLSRQGRVLIYLDKEGLRSLVAAQNVSSFVLSSGRGRAIPLIGTDDPAGDGFITMTRISDSGRSYACALPESAVFKDWYAQLLLTALVIAASSLTGGLLCIRFARRNSTPITDMVRLLSGHTGRAPGEDGTVFDYLRGGVADLLSDRQLLSSELERRIPLLQVTFAERLLSGTIANYDDLEGQLRDLRIPLHAPRYCVAVLRLVSSGADEPDLPPDGTAARLLIEAALRRALGGNIYIYTMDDECVTVIAGLADGEDEAVLEERCRRAAAELSGRNGVCVQAAVGLAYEGLADVFLSFSQAKRALDALAVSPGLEVVRYGRLSGGEDYFYFPVELEARLIRATVGGNTAAVEGIFEELHEENVHRHPLSDGMYHRFLGELDGAYLKVLHALREGGIPTQYLDEKYHQPPHSDPSGDEFVQLRLMFLEACHVVGYGKKRRGEKTRERIEDYIAAHYGDASLNLAMISGEFGVTEVHMSRLFKEQMGVTFSQYLEETRMKHAHDLLSHSDATVAGVAAACGYSSPHAFRRAYKRFYGNLPSEERNS